MMERMPGTIRAEICLSTEQVAQILSSAQVVDRHAAMVDKYGEACSKTTAAKIISCGSKAITNMLEDGRIKPACGGTRVDVRSLADYIECRSEADHAARMRRKGMRKYV